MAAVPKIQLMYACVLDLYQQAHAKVGCLNIAGKKKQTGTHTCLQSWLFFSFLV